MEDTLEVYHRPYDEHRPLVCFDEGTTPWVKDIRAPLPAAPGRQEHIDDEYERNGTGNLFMMCEPLAGRREVLVTVRRTAVDYAEAIQHLVDVRSPSAEHIVLVQDNLNTHTLASLSEAFPPEEARRGYDRMVGALSNLGYRISGQTVGNIVKRHGLSPASERQKTTTWRECICIHMDMLMATDFFTHAEWSWFGLMLSALLCFLHCGRHNVREAGMTLHGHLRRVLPCLSRFLDGHTFMERWERLVTAVARLWLMLFDKGVMRLGNS